MFALVDCNNFYCSCERVFNPALNNRPVIVLSNNDGCAIARSEEAKAVGIVMGAPAHLIRDIIEKHKVAVFSSNYTLYGDMSDRVMKTLGNFAPTIELYSIDEAFLDMSKLKYQSLPAVGAKMRTTVKQHTGIPVSVGIAPSKTLAKMANRFAKKDKKEIGVHSLHTPALIQEALAWTEIGDVWGLGHQYAKLLKGYGFHTAADFIKAPEDWVRKELTVVGLRLHRELRGIPSIKFELFPPAKKNICTSRSFGTLVTDKKLLIEACANYTALCARKLRTQKTCAGKLQVFVQTNEHRTQDQQYKASIVIQLTVPSNNTTELVKHAMKGLNIIFKPGIKYLKIGVIVMDIVPDTEIQSALFDTVDRKKSSVVMATLDKINRALGKDVLRVATQGYERKWRLRAEHLSQRYTTRIDELYTLKN